jgi:hypothetical protein
LIEIAGVDEEREKLVIERIQLNVLYFQVVQKKKKNCHRTQQAMHTATVEGSRLQFCSVQER